MSRIDNIDSEAASPAHGSNQPFAVEIVPVSILRVSDSCRVFSAADRRKARAIARRFKIEQPLVVTDDNEVVIGEVLLIAAQEAGIETVPVIRLKAISPLEAKALSIAYQKLGDLGVNDRAKIGEYILQFEATLDLEATDIGFEIAEIDLMICEPECEEQDEVPRLEPVPVSEPGDLWTLGQHRLIHGDALDGGMYEQVLAGAKAHAVFTDPPYGCRIDGFVAGKGRHREFVMGSGEMSEAELSELFTGFNRNLIPHLAPGAVVYEAIDWRSLHLLMDATRPILGPLVNLAVWSKDRAGQGSFLRSQHELILIFKTRGRMRNNVQLGRYGRNRSNVWNYPSAVTSGKGSEEGNILAEHPTPKPVRMIADALLDTTRRGDLVIDPFVGSGSTIIACERVGRRARAIELDTRYVDLSIRRWQAWTGEKAVQASTGETFDERAATATARAEEEAHGEAA
jgi:DNA modification methylase